MRKFLTKLIVTFAKLVTFGMSFDRRGNVYWRVARVLFSLNVIEGRTSKGTLLLDAECRNFIDPSKKTRSLEEFEPDTLDWVYSLPDNACLWDIGSHVGIIGLLASFNSTVQVIGFEPAYRNYSVLNRNIELNNLDQRFRTYCLAFAESSYLETLNMENTSAGSSMHGFGVETDQFDRRIKTKYRQGTVGFSIDDFVNKFSPPLPTHVKIDVDGLEPQILRGGKNTLSNPSVKSMIVEVQERPGSNRSSEIYEILSQYGFEAQPKASPDYRNVIFERVC